MICWQAAAEQCSDNQSPNLNLPLPIAGVDGADQRRETRYVNCNNRFISACACAVGSSRGAVVCSSCACSRRSTRVPRGVAGLGVAETSRCVSSAPCCVSGSVIAGTGRLGCCARETSIALVTSCAPPAALACGHLPPADARAAPGCRPPRPPPCRGVPCLVRGTRAWRSSNVTTRPRGMMTCPASPRRGRRVVTAAGQGGCPPLRAGSAVPW